MLKLKILNSLDLDPEPTHETSSGHGSGPWRMTMMVLDLFFFVIPNLFRDLVFLGFVKRLMEREEKNE